MNLRKAQYMGVKKTYDVNIPVVSIKNTRIERVRYLGIWLEDRNDK